MEVVFRNNDNLIEVRELQQETTGNYLNSATVEVTLYDDEDNEISGESWPLTLSYVSGSDGKYRATLSKDLQLGSVEEGKAVVTADSGAGYAEWTVEVIYENRGQGS